MVDERLSHRHADLLFAVQCDGREAFVYVLLEHQSEPDRFIPFRMLRYIVRLWERFLKDHPEARRLPVIVPVVVHHGAAGWISPLELRELIDLDSEHLAAVAPYVPDFRFLLDDLARTSVEELCTRGLTALGRAVLLLFRNARVRTREELRDDIAQWSATFVDVLGATTGAPAFWALMRYILVVSELESDDIRSFAHALGPKAEETTMTGLEKLLKEGEAIGKAKGEVIGKAKGEVIGKASLLIRLLTLRFGNLPDGVEARVRQATLDELDLFGERILTAASLDDVLR